MKDNNEARIARAESVLNHYTELHRSRIYDDEPVETRVVDLISDLMHLTARDGEDELQTAPEYPVSLLDTVRMHYEAESGGGDEFEDDDD